MSLPLRNSRQSPTVPYVLRQLSAAPAVRAFAIWAFLFTSLLAYGWLFFYRDPGCMFFDPDHAYERKYTAVREAEAEAFMHAAHANYNENEPKRNVNNNTDTRMCLAYVSVGRDVGRQYIYNAIGSILHGLTPTERASLHLSVLFGDADPTWHPAYTQPWFLSLIDDPFTYASGNLQPKEQEHLRNLQFAGFFEEKGILDYTIAIHRCLQTTNAPYIAIFEDDTIAVQGWLSRVMHGLGEAKKLMQTQEDKAREKGESVNGQDKSSWIYLRLFNQERSTGWASTEVGGNHEFLISFLVALGIVVVAVPLRTKVRLLRHHVTNATLVIVCLVAVPSFVILFFQMGKNSLLPPGPGVREEDFGCCSQGLVFNRAHLEGLVNFLRERRAGRCDLMTGDYAGRNGLKRLSMYPMVMQHIGKTFICTFHVRTGQADKIQVSRPPHEQRHRKRKQYGAWPSKASKRAASNESTGTCWATCTAKRRYQN